MKLDRVISRVKAMLLRASTAEEMARLTNLLVILQNEFILELQKKNVTDRRKAA